MSDLINGLYEVIGGLFVLLSCRQLYHDKQVRGLSIWHVMFFVTWGYWNLYFYPHVGAVLSGIGAIGVAVANTIWLGMIVWYSYLKPR